MGAESSAIQDLQVGEPSYSSEKCGWILHQGKTRSQQVSVFLYKSDQSEKVSNVVQNLKTIRHPAVLKFFSMGKVSGKSALITEPVQPLESVLPSLTAIEVSAGLCNIVDALQFLHEKAHVSHNNVCMSVIFIGADGSWKLGGMDCACPVENATKTVVDKYKSMRDESAIPPEDKDKGSKETIPSHARDVYALGALASSLMEKMEGLGDDILNFAERVEDDLMNPDPNQRPRLSEIVNDRIFRNDYIEISNFLKNITIKSEEEKDEFFTTLVKKLRHLPLELVAARLTPLLLARFVLLDERANKHLLPNFLTPKAKGMESIYKENGLSPILPEKLFKSYLLPEIYKIFHVRDAAVRKTLLEHFPCYVQMFDKGTLQSFILPQLLVGMRDKDDDIVALSLHALGDLVPIVGGNVVVGRERIKYFTQGKPKVNQVYRTRLKQEKTLLELSELNGTHSTERKKHKRDLRLKQNNEVLKTSEPSSIKSSLSASLHPKSTPVLEDSSIVSPLVPNAYDIRKLSPEPISKSPTHFSNKSDDEHWSDWEDNEDVISSDVTQLPLATSSNFPLSGSLDLLSSPIRKPTKNSMVIRKPTQDSKVDNLDTLSTASSDTISSNQSYKGDGTRVKTKKAGDELGGIFDIKKIEIKGKEAEKNELDELFADMQPKIQTQHIDVFSMLSSQSVNSSLDVVKGAHENLELRFDGKKEGQGHSKADAFAYTAQDDQVEEGGWGDDFDDDWGDNVVHDLEKNAGKV